MRSVQPVLLVRSCAQSLEVNLSFFYHGRQVNFLRKREDSIAAVLKRMQLNIAKLQLKQKSTGAYSGTVAVRFLDQRRIPINEGTLSEVLDQARHFHAGDIEYRIVSNAPRPVLVCILHPVVANAPVLLKLEMENVESNSTTNFRFSWTVDEGYSEERIFFPRSSEAGKKLSVSVCNPELSEFAVEYTCHECILPDPGFSPFSLQTQLPPTSEKFIRVGSFNILAQGYVSTDLAKTVMYPHIKDERLLQFSYRNSLIVREILNFNGDLVLLQEVSPSFLEMCYRPFLAGRDSFVGVFAMKSNSQRPNGVGVLARSHKFAVSEQFQWSLGGDDLKEAFSQREWMTLVTEFGAHFDQVVIPNITTVAAVSVLFPKSPDHQPVIAVSTHLFYHPLGGHIRLLQTIALTRKLATLKSKYQNAAIILGGDLNSRPDRAAVQFLRTGKVDESDEDWKFGPVFRWNFESEDDEGVETLPNLSLSASVSTPVRGISAAHDLHLDWSFIDDKLPDITHATASFRAVLDYIFVSRDFAIIDDLKQLHASSVDIDAVGGLPCASYGSDHILLGAELKIN